MAPLLLLAAAPVSRPRRRGVASRLPGWRVVLPGRRVAGAIPAKPGGTVNFVNFAPGWRA